jgi:hypothetical protein
MVDYDSPIMGNDAKEPRLLVPSPTPDAGTYRRGHRDRLTWQRVPSIPISFGGSRAANRSVSSHVCRLKTTRECLFAGNSLRLPS